MEGRCATATARRSEIARVLQEHARPSLPRLRPRSRGVAHSWSVSINPWGHKRATGKPRADQRRGWPTSTQRDGGTLCVVCFGPDRRGTREPDNTREMSSSATLRGFRDGLFDTRHLRKKRAACGKDVKAVAAAPKKNQ